MKISHSQPERTNYPKKIKEQYCSLRLNGLRIQLDRRNTRKGYGVIEVGLLINLAERVEVKRKVFTPPASRWMVADRNSES